MTDQALPDTGASATDSGMSGVSSAEFWGAFQSPASEPTKESEQSQEGAQITEAEAEPPEAEESESPADEVEYEGAKPKPAKGVQKRLDELTWEKHEANRRAQAAEAQAAQLLELVQRLTDGQAQPEKPADKRKPDLGVEAPNPEDYMVGEQFDALTYQRDLATHLAKATVAEELAALRQQQEQAEAARAQAQQQAEFQAATTEAAKAHPDYWDAIEAAKAHPFFHSPLSAMVAADANGAELAYELAKAPEQMDQLVRLPPQLALMQLGRISAAIDARKAAPPPAPRTSNAPKPPNPVTRASASTDSGYLGRDDLSFGDWEARRNAELRGARAR